MPLPCSPLPLPFSHALETAVDEDELSSAALLHLHVQALSFYPNQPDVRISSSIFKTLTPATAVVCHISASKNGRTI